MQQNKIKRQLHPPGCGCLFCAGGHNEYPRNTDGGGGTLIVLLTLVQIAPIKLNPWSAIVKWIGHALNAEVLEKQQETQKKLDEHIRVDDERNANLLRTQILRFNDELIDDKHHTREHFIETLAIIDAYEDYCRSHPNYKNNRCICAVANIKRVYNERLQKHDFS